MGILSSVSLGVQQTLMHILQELEAEGITSIVDVRTKISMEINKQFPPSRRVKYRKPPENQLSSIYCPKCPEHTQIMTPIKVDEDGVDVLVMQCKKCRYSYLV